MASYANDLRLKEIATGDESGTWGTSTNTNLSLIADAFSYGTIQLAADANETFTMPDATADGTRSLYLKVTSAGSLTATREVTLGPNTVSKVWIIENATTGSQIITIKQGSGATVNVPNGSKVMVATDGAGAGAAVLNATPTEIGGTVTSVDVSGGTTGLTTSGGPITSSGTITLAGTLAVANGGTGITSLGTGVATWLGTPSSANLRAALTDETGTGSAVFATSPTLTTPNLGTPSAATLTNATGLPISTGVSGLGSGVATWLGTPSSANLASAVTDETGSGALVFGTAPTLSGAILNDGYTEEVYALGTSGALTLEPDNGSIQTCALSGAPTFSDGFSAGQSIVLMLTNGASYAVTWPTITWVTSAGNAAPTLTAADTLVFWKVATTLYGAYVGSYV